MKHKDKGLNLGDFYFDYQSRFLMSQSIWMHGLWIELSNKDDFRFDIEIQLDSTNKSYLEWEKYLSDKWEKEFQKNYQEFVPKLGDFRPFFIGEPIKEEALGFFVLATGYGDKKCKHKVPFGDEKYAENKYSFYEQSRRYYLLSLCYKHFFKIQQAVEEVFGIDGESCFLDLDQLKYNICHDTSDLLTYWSIGFKRRRLGQKGGSIPKRLPGILLAVKKIIRDNPQKYHSAEFLWNVFEKRHKGRKKAIKIGGFKIYLDYKDLINLEERIFQISSDEKVESIGRSAFSGYVKEAKQPSK